MHYLIITVLSLSTTVAFSITLSTNHFSPSGQNPTPQLQLQSDSGWFCASWFPTYGLFETTFLMLIFTVFLLMTLASGCPGGKHLLIKKSWPMFLLTYF